MHKTKLTAAVGTAALALVVPGAAQARLKTCRDRGYEDLKAQGVRCDTAARVYRASLRIAQGTPDDDPLRFRYVGLRWSCRASNPHRVIAGRYVNYVWRCTASGDRVVQYRWLTGE